MDRINRINLGLGFAEGQAILELNKRTDRRILNQRVAGNEQLRRN